jgi:hypothetical protein
MRKNISFLALFFVFSLFGPLTFAQKTLLRSELDENLTINSVSVAPLFDNVSGIYAKPLQTQLSSIIEEDRQWSLTSFPLGNSASPEDFEDNPAKVISALSKNNADSLISGRITRGPQGISMKLNLFLKKDGLLIAQSKLENYSGFEIADLREQIKNLYQDLKTKLPYSGVILSRKGNLVTINVGSLQGVKDGDELNVVQLIKIQRHPKFNFIVSAEKEIIGRLKVTKSDVSLSFADVTLERYENVLQPKMKVEIIRFVEHRSSTQSEKSPDLSERKDSVFLGDSPQEWTPAESPKIGKLALLLGLSNYSLSNTLESSGGVNASRFPTPTIGINTELWLTSQWLLNFRLQQHIVNVSNNLEGSGPGNISIAASQMGFFVGHNFLLSDSLVGPKFQVLGGYTQLSAQVDSSSPTAYTSVKMSGFGIGLNGSMPVDEKLPLSVGAQLVYYLTGQLDESPVTSGSSSSVKISQFSFFGNYQWTPRMNWRGELNYDLYSASLSGSGTRSESASSISHTLTNFLFGLEYLF